MQFSALVIAAISTAASAQLTANVGDQTYVGAYVTSVPSMTMLATPAVSTVSPAVISTISPAVVSTIVPGVGTTVIDGSTVLTTTAASYPPILAASYQSSYDSAMSSVSSMSAAAAAESKALKDERHRIVDQFEEACDDVDECEEAVEQALKGEWPNAADNLQIQLTAVAVGFFALGGAFVLI